MRISSDDFRSGLAHRPELDGLRGIAIASVVAYHLGGRLAPGGFVGVDLFFVLSGFLITQLIVSDLEFDRFSILGFYERRVRRIVPALLFVCACCTAIALTIFLPGELKDYCSSLLAALLSASNLWFFQHSGYFDRAADTHPLLHTWSLGVEEQFYILFPVLLWGLFRLTRSRMGSAIWVLFALSLGVSIIALPQHPQSTFFLLHTRAWELLTGSIVALGLVPHPISRVHREVGGLVGLSAIALAIFAYDSQTPFPGAAALLPCLGAGLIIWSGPGDSLVSRALSCKPLIFLGLVSYSLYLWHWPLIVFVRAISAAPLDVHQQGALAALSFILATGTWRFVSRRIEFPNDFLERRDWWRCSRCLGR
jgi:peptidoglycan/LPS O-acetylase OafA/YrhL